MIFGFFIGFILFLFFICVLYRLNKWGLGIGDWGLGIGPIPNPQSPIPQPQSPNLKNNLL